MKLPFDKCYCLHLVEATDRYDNCVNQFNKLGILNQVDFWWTCKRSISTKVGNFLTELHTPFYNGIYKCNENVYSGVFNCSLEHYTIVKQSYLRGYNSILIIEDDIFFNEDINYIEDIFNNLPEDYDVIKFYSMYVFNNYYIDQQNKISHVNKHFTNNIFGICSTKMYALSRNGMKMLIEKYDEAFNPSDIVLDRIKYKNDNNENWFIPEENLDIKFYILEKNDLVKDPNKFISLI